METKKHVYQKMIREHHLDTYGHVNNAKYVELLEEARWELITPHGFGLEDIMKNKIGPVILGIEVQFRSELKNRENITIETEMLEYSGKVGKMKQVIRRENGTEACIATLTFGLFDLTARKLILPTPEWKSAIGMS